MRAFIIILGLACLFIHPGLKAQIGIDTNYIRMCVSETFEHYPDIIGKYYSEKDTIDRLEIDADLPDYRTRNVPRMRQASVYLVPGQNRALFDFTLTYFDVYEAPITLTYCGKCDRKGDIIWTLDSTGHQFYLMHSNLNPVSEYYMATAQIGYSYEFENVFVDPKGRIMEMFPYEPKIQLWTSSDHSAYIKSLAPGNTASSPFPIRYKNLRTGQQWERYFPDQHPSVVAIEKSGEYVLLKHEDTLRCYNSKGELQWQNHSLAQAKIVSSTFNTFLVLDNQEKTASIYGKRLEKVLFSTSYGKFLDNPSGITMLMNNHVDDHYFIGSYTEKRKTHALLLNAEGIVAQTTAKVGGGRKPIGQPMMLKEKGSNTIRVYNSHGQLFFETKGRKDGTDNSTFQQKD